MEAGAAVHTHYHATDQLIDVGLAARDAPPSTEPGISQLSAEELEVHPAIVVDGSAGQPPYILRDHDHQVRAALAGLLEPDARPVMITVVGTSCTGKTRTAYEAVKAVLPNWPVLRPARNTNQLSRLLDTGIPGDTVLWLDELKNYLALTPADSRTAQQLLELLTSPHTPRIAIITTTWETDLTALDVPHTPEVIRAGMGAVHQLLTYTEAFRCYLPDRFTHDQIAALNRSADPRFRQAATTAHRGQLIQVLGGGTLLLDRYLADHGDRNSPAGKAIIAAAMDLRRIGHPNPIPDWAITGAAAGYLPEQHRIQSDNWTELGLADVTAEIRGVRALIPTRTAPGIGPADAHHLHDYLYQHHLKTNRYQGTHQDLWNALTDHADQLAPNVAKTIANNAKGRGLFTTAITLYTPAANDGDEDAEWWLTRLAAWNGDLVTLTTRADNGAQSAEWRLAELLAEQGDLTRLTALADDGDPIADQWLVDLLAEQGDLTRLTARADNGDQYAHRKLAELLAEQSNMPILTVRASKSDVEREDDDMAELPVGPGPTWDVWPYDLATLTALADDGDYDAERRLAVWLASQGDLATLTARADNGNESAQERLAALLTKSGNIEGLKAQVNAGSHAAADAVIELLVADCPHDRMRGHELDTNIDLVCPPK